MKRVFFLAPLALAALAGCSPAPSQIQAGQWEVVTEGRSLDAPNTRNQASQQPRMLSQRVSSTECISEESARAYVQDFRRVVPPTCTASDEVYANGVMKIRISCPGQNGQPGARVTMDGTFTKTTFNTRINLEEPAPPGSTQASTRSSVVRRARRIGDCPAGAARPALPGQL